MAYPDEIGLYPEFEFTLGSKTQHVTAWTSYLQTSEAWLNGLRGEVVGARGVAASLDARLDGLVPYSGATGNLDMGAYRISAAAALLPGQITTLSQVLGLITGGASPADLPITDLDPGTATDGQLYGRVGGAVVGVSVPALRLVSFNNLFHGA